jgi:hypothetical protein
MRSVQAAVFDKLNAYLRTPPLQQHDVPSGITHFPKALPAADFAKS